jgi:hypothetical protein
MMGCHPSATASVWLPALLWLAPLASAAPEAGDGVMEEMGRWEGGASHCRMERQPPRETRRNSASGSNAAACGSTSRWVDC